jgi:hypothetical protein
VSFWYLASPYSKLRDTIGLDAAADQVAAALGRLIVAKVPAFSPIVHTHPVAQVSGLDPLDHTIWMPADQPFMDTAKGLIVLTMPGYRDSYGVAQEVFNFTEAGKPVVFWHPDDAVPVEKLI